MLIVSSKEVYEVLMKPEDKFIVIASDGVWEFLSNEAVMNMIVPYWRSGNIDGACERVVKESVQMWKRVSTRLNE